MSLNLNRRHMLMGGSALVASTQFAWPGYAQDTSLRMMFWGGQDRANRTFGVADSYQQKTGVRIEGEFMAFSDYWPKLATLTAGGNGPDVVQMDGAGRYVADYARRGAIAPLDEFLGNALKLDDFDQDQLDAGKVAGKLYAISLGANASCLVVNKTAFEAAGLDIPGPTTTYDDLRAMDAAIKAANPGMRLISDASGVWSVLEHWLHQRNKTLYTADGGLGFNAADAGEWFALWAGLRADEVCLNPEDQAIQGGIETSSLITKKAAMSCEFSNLLVAYQGVSDDRLALTNLPRIAIDAPPGHYRRASMFFSVGGTSSTKEEAARFINYFVNDHAANKVLGAERGIPCSASVREALAPELDEQSRMALEYVGGLGPLLGPAPPLAPAGGGEINESLLSSVSQEVAFGARSPEEGGQYLVEAATDILSRAD